MFEIKLDDAAVQAKLKALHTKLGNLRPVMAEIGEEMIESVKDRFASSTGPDGQVWAANKESTLLGMLRETKGNFKQKAGKNDQTVGGRRLSAKGGRRVSGKKPLVASGTLASTIHYKPTATSLEIGSNLIYSRVQQKGAKQGAFGNMKKGQPIPWGDIPARPYLGFSDEDKRSILDILTDYLESA